MLVNAPPQVRNAYRNTAIENSGFTVIELIVSISVIGILLAILIPAVQQSRASARRFTCTNHLRQIGLANHHFLDSQGHFPPHHFAHLKLLPYLEQQALHDKFTTKKNLKGDLPLYQCPSDPYISDGEYSASYLINGGTIPLFKVNNKFTQMNGMIGAWRMQDVTDGASATAFYSERLKTFRPIGEDYSKTNQPNRYWWKVDLKSLTVNDLADACSHPRSRKPSSSGSIPNSGEIGGSLAFYDHIVTPNIPLCGVDGTTLATAPATSLHPGGVNVLLVDGSVRFFSEKVSREVWRAYGTRSGGEPVSGF